jgi:pyruvate/2-oxoglutarate dehydrogenase complex dihydrolipoamide dehydrogenase (E3) component
MESEVFDLVVIGAEPAGEKGAVTAAFLGKRVAIVERSPLVGGGVANTGTLPSKTLRETALALSGINARELYGVDLSLRREATVADLMRHEQTTSWGAPSERPRGRAHSAERRVSGPTRSSTTRLTAEKSSAPNPAVRPSV